jgi:ribosomal protein S25
MTPTSTASKAEHNQRKREKAKNRKAEEHQKAANEAHILEEMGTVSLKEKIQDNSRQDNVVPQSSLAGKFDSFNNLTAKGESTKEQLGNGTGQ